MVMIAEWLKVEGENVLQELQEAGEKLSGADGEVGLDFSSVARIDTGELESLEKLASKADERSFKVALRGVNVDVYRVLKLAKLTARFTFVA